MVTPMTHVKNSIRKVWRAILSYVLPDRTKRLILLASLGYRFREKGSVSTITIERLNALMKLCHSQDALPLTGKIGKVIWNDTLILDVSQELQQVPAPSPVYLNPIVEKLLSVMPGWLRYSDEEVIKDELMTVLRYERAAIA